VSAASAVVKAAPKESCYREQLPSAAQVLAGLCRVPLFLMALKTGSGVLLSHQISKCSVLRIFGKRYFVTNPSCWICSSQPDQAEASEAFGWQTKSSFACFASHCVFAWDACAAAAPLAHALSCLCSPPGTVLLRSAGSNTRFLAPGFRYWITVGQSLSRCERCRCLLLRIIALPSLRCLSCVG
jgi:hypothetical protein